MNKIVSRTHGLLVLMGSLLLASPSLTAAELVVAPIASSEGSAGDGTAAAPRISADGRWVVFTSEAGNLIADDRNAAVDVFMRDRQSGSTLLVSRRDGDGGSGHGTSLAPDLTPDGRFVVFQSTATDLVPDGLVPPTTNAWRSLIYRFDRTSDEMRLINVNRPAPTPNPYNLPTLTNVARGLVSPRVSPDGQRVLFSTGRNRLELDANDITTPREPDALFLWAASDGTTEHITEGYPIDPVTQSAEYIGQQRDDSPLMSQDGRYVAFADAGYVYLGTTKVMLDRMNVIVRDRLAATNFVPNWVHESGSGVFAYSLLGGISGDGQYVLYERRHFLVGDSLQASGYDGDNVWLHHLSSGQVTCVSSNSLTGLVGDATSERGSISADGNWIAYFSKASNLVAGDGNGIADVFLYDRVNHLNTRISTHPGWQGVVGGRIETSPKLTPDGRFIVYQAIGSGLFRYDRIAGTNALITTDVMTESADISADGRFVVFTASPSSINLSDSNPYRQVYCHDFETGVTELISVRDGNIPVATPNGPTSLELGAVSATGRFIAFTSFATDIESSASRTGQLWVRDTQLGTNILVSVDKDGNPLTGTDVFRNVQMSADGRWICFVARNATLVDNDANGKDDVFLRDLQAGVTLVVSKTMSSGDPGSDKSFDPVMARDGSIIVFNSWASGIASPGGIFDLFGYDVASASNANLNRDASNPSFGANFFCDLPVLNSDGSWMLFRTQASNLTPENCFGTPDHVVIRDLRGNGPAHCVTNAVGSPPLLQGNIGKWSISANGQWYIGNIWNADRSEVYMGNVGNGAVSLVTTNGYLPLTSNDGLTLVWQSKIPVVGYADTNGTWDIVHYRTDLGINRVISLDQTGTKTGDGASRLIALSPDGRYVLFRSLASNLVAGDQNKSMDLFLRDTATDMTVLLSRNLAGTGTADNFSGKAVFTDDGTKIVFESFASDIVANDFNLERDVFVAQLQLPDSDGDQIPDDWEFTYFNNLDQDGSGDTDQDGINDLDEFRAGTSPVNSESLLRAITVTGIGSGSTTVLWLSIPGRSYQVQSRDNFGESDWTNLGDLIVASSTTTSASDPAPADPDRFYRVLLME